MAMDVTKMTDEEVKAAFLNSMRSANLGAGFWQAMYADRRAARAERRLQRLTWAIVVLTGANVVLVAVDVVLVLARH